MDIENHLENRCLSGSGTSGNNTDGMGIVLNYSDRPYTFNVPEVSKVLVGTEEIPTAGVLVFSM